LIVISRCCYCCWSSLPKFYSHRCFFSVICCILLFLLLFSPNFLFYRTVGFLLFRSYHLSILLLDRNSFSFVLYQPAIFCRADLVPVAKLACPLPFPRTVFRSAVSLARGPYLFAPFSFQIIGILCVDPFLSV
jgi:hypothetical protein